MAADEPTPVSLIVSPYLNSGGGGPFLGTPDPLRSPPFTQPHWPALVERGFTEVQVEPRGFGGSTGCVDFGGPDEQSDVRTAVTWAAAQPWSTGKVGIFGWSYEGGMAASAVRNPPPGLSAAMLGVPITSYYRYVQTNGVSNGTFGETIYNVPHSFVPPSVNDDPSYLVASAGGTGEDPRCQVEGTRAAYEQRYETDP